MISFSIVIPIYNKEPFLAETLTSVLAQKHPHFEILILNDGSTDNSQQVIDGFKDDRIRKFHSQNIGAGAARNFLIAQAAYEHIAFLDADDLWQDNHLKELARLVEKYPDERVFATNTIKTVGKTTIHRNYSIDIANKQDLVTDFFEASFLDCILITSATMIHKEVFEKTGTYDVNIKSGQDIDLYIRFAHQYKIAFSPCITATIVGNPSSLSNATNYKDKMSFEALMPFENENKKAKKYYDLNRYALGILAKEQGYTASFSKLVALINPKNLHWKQKMLLKLPPLALSILLQLKRTLFQLGYSFTVFK